MKLLPFGERAVLAEFDDLAETMTAYQNFSRNPPAGVLELVPAARTVLVQIDPKLISLRATADWLSRSKVEAFLAPAAASIIEIPVRYNGLDLESTAEMLGFSVPELIEWHSSTLWQCAFIGFAPGFAYLAESDPKTPRLAVPRLETSRAAVPAGSVGLAAEFTGIYPRSSPGGWRLIGTTETELWNLGKNPPALLSPGCQVRFVVMPSDG